jgi:hypothetical protein
LIIRATEREAFTELLHLFKIDINEIWKEDETGNEGVVYHLNSRQLEKYLVGESEKLTLLIESDVITSTGLKILKNASLVLQVIIHPLSWRGFA